MRRLLLPAAVAAVLCAALQNSARAQSIDSQEISRGLNPNGGASRFIPYDGAPFSHRYNYNLGAGILYFNGSASQQYYLDYLDKVDRAQRFGYPMPRPPFAPVVVQQAAPVLVQPGAVPPGNVPPNPLPPNLAAQEPAPEVIYVAPPPRTSFGFGFFRWR